jgi:hypothetical protein
MLMKERETTVNIENSFSKDDKIYICPILGMLVFDYKVMKKNIFNM